MWSVENQNNITTPGETTLQTTRWEMKKRCCICWNRFIHSPLSRSGADTHTAAHGGPMMEKVGMSWRKHEEDLQCNKGKVWDRSSREELLWTDWNSQFLSALSSLGWEGGGLGKEGMKLGLRKKRAEWWEEGVSVFVFVSHCPNPFYLEINYFFPTEPALPITVITEWSPCPYLALPLSHPLSCSESEWVGIQPSNVSQLHLGWFLSLSACLLCKLQVTDVEIKYFVPHCTPVGSVLEWCTWYFVGLRDSLESQ